MDQFDLIQNFFAQMQCHHCKTYFVSDGIELVREEHGVFVVSVYCHGCKRQVGLAMVGVETAASISIRKFKDPELTEAELDRFSGYKPILEDDVLEAHQFIQGLGRDWQKHIPAEMLERCTAPDTESLTD